MEERGRKGRGGFIRILTYSLSIVNSTGRVQINYPCVRGVSRTHKDNIGIQS